MTTFTEEQYAQAFRKFQAEHIERQTAALETIRGVLLLLVVLALLGSIAGVALAFA